MNIVDIVILVILLAFAIVGFKRGVLQSIVSFIGFILVVYLAYLLKNYLGDIFVLDLPFIDFKIASITSVVMNVIMYQSLALLIMIIVFGLIYKFLLYLSGIVEKIFRATIILGIPSKILGLVVGILEGYVVVYLLLFFVSQPYVNTNIISDSKYANTILTKTPVLSDFAGSTLEIANEVNVLIKNKDNNEFDLKLSELILKHKVVSPEVMEKLVSIKKIKVDGLDEIINKYKNGGEVN